MIKKVTITNHLGESITLELRFPEKSGFLVRDINGLGPSKANINVVEVATHDGAIYNSARVNKRNILFDLVFIEKPTIEDTRQRSYKYFPIKRRVSLVIETDNRICVTYGYVESNEPNIFSPQESAVISIVCPDSYLFANENSVTFFSVLTSLFEFPFSNESLVNKLLEFGDISLNSTKSVINSGDAAVGFIMYIHAVGSATNVVISDITTQESMTIDSTRLVTLTGSDIVAGDDIIISTIKGSKYIYLLRGGVFTNILNCLGIDPVWLQLERGDNVFAITADSGAANLQVRVESQIAYEGA